MTVVSVIMLNLGIRARLNLVGLEVMAACLALVQNPWCGHRQNCRPQ